MRPLLPGLLLALACACASAGKPPPPLSESAVRLDLPLVRQDALYDCGLASISALCQYWGVAIPDAERAELARTAQERSGLSGDELRTALEQLGLETYLFRGSLDRTPTGLYGHVDAGRPPLVMLSADGSAHHYGLVLGYDEERGNLILLDPRKGEVLMPVALFERNWERCQRFTLLASRRDESGAANERP
jgi:ABC-type bacteriocin/lantibiotic exporter with double-glycine peptidase domain